MAFYSPTMAAIRYGYGIAPDQTSGANADDLLAQLSEGQKAQPAFPRGGIEAARNRAMDYANSLADIRKNKGDDEPGRERRVALQKQVGQSLQRDSVARVMQSVASPYGLHERLAAFWFDHFSVSALKSQPMRLLTPIYEAEAIRPNMAGDFRTLLRAAVLHPAMLIYLDQDRSTGPESAAGQNRKRGLNENLGRELLELHTLGAGSGYTQKDVRSAALVLTGMTVDDTYEMDFRGRMAEPGRMQVLGASYGGENRSAEDCRMLLDDLAARPETAEHICRKLVTHFIADEAPKDITGRMVSAWKASAGDLMKVYQAMLTHPRAWSDPAMKMKLPFDYVVSGLRALGIGDQKGLLEMSPDGDDEVTAPPGNANATAQMNLPSGDMAQQTPDKEIKADPRRPALARTLTIAALRRMGQPVWQPPSPAGFEEGVATWLSASQLSERILWARRAASSLGTSIEPRDMVRTVLAEMARDDTARVVAQAPNRVSGITLVLSSPEFNRR